MSSALLASAFFWFFGQAAELGLTALLKRQDLNSVITAAVDEWYENLPNDIELHPNFLYAHLIQLLQQEMQQPSGEGIGTVVSEALLEAWRRASQESGPKTGFFKLSESEAASHFRDLGRTLENAILPTEHGDRHKLTQIHSWVADLRDREHVTDESLVRYCAKELRDVASAAERVSKAREILATPDMSPDLEGDLRHSLAAALYATGDSKGAYSAFIEAGECFAKAGEEVKQKRVLAKSLLCKDDHESLRTLLEQATQDHPDSKELESLLVWLDALEAADLGLWFKQQPKTLKTKRSLEQVALACYSRGNWEALHSVTSVYLRDGHRSPFMLWVHARHRKEQVEILAAAGGDITAATRQNLLETASYFADAVDANDALPASEQDPDITSDCILSQLDIYRVIGERERAEEARLAAERRFPTRWNVIRGTHLAAYSAGNVADALEGAHALFATLANEGDNVSEMAVIACDAALYALDSNRIDDDTLDESLLTLQDLWAKMAPRPPPSLTLRANVINMSTKLLIRRGKNAEAEALLTSAIDTDEDLIPFWHFLLAKMYLDVQKDVPAASSFARKAHEALGPVHPSFVRLAIAEVLHTTQQYEACVSCLAVLDPHQMSMAVARIYFDCLKETGRLRQMFDLVVQRSRLSPSVDALELGLEVTRFIDLHQAFELLRQCPDLLKGSTKLFSSWLLLLPIFGTDKEREGARAAFEETIDAKIGSVVWGVNEPQLALENSLRLLLHSDGGHDERVRYVGEVAYTASWFEKLPDPNTLCYVLEDSSGHKERYATKDNRYIRSGEGPMADFLRSEPENGAVYRDSLGVPMRVVARKPLWEVVHDEVREGLLASQAMSAGDGAGVFDGERIAAVLARDREGREEFISNIWKSANRSPYMASRLSGWPIDSVLETVWGSRTASHVPPPVPNIEAPPEEILVDAVALYTLWRGGGLGISELEHLPFRLLIRPWCTLQMINWCRSERERESLLQLLRSQKFRLSSADHLLSTREGDEHGFGVRPDMSRIVGQGPAEVLDGRGVFWCDDLAQWHARVEQVAVTTAWILQNCLGSLDADRRLAIKVNLWSKGYAGVELSATDVDTVVASAGRDGGRYFDMVLNGLCREHLNLETATGLVAQLVGVAAKHDREAGGLSIGRLSYAMTSVPAIAACRGVPVDTFVRMTIKVLENMTEKGILMREELSGIMTLMLIH